MLKNEGKGNLVVLLLAERAQSRINQAALSRAVKNRCGLAGRTF
jgi:hypothetical protein